MKTNIDFLKYRKFAFLGSGLIILLGIIFFVIRGGFNLSLDFRGGILATIKIENEEIIKVDDIRSLLVSDLIGIQVTERINKKNVFEITYMPEEKDSIKDIGITSVINNKVLTTLRDRYGNGFVVRVIGNEDADTEVEKIVNSVVNKIEGFDFTSKKDSETITKDDKEKTITKYIYRIKQTPDNYKVENLISIFNDTNLGNSEDFELSEIVGLMHIDSFEPTVGKDIQSVALSVTLLIVVLILGYLALRFRFKFGVAAIIAVLHDSLIILSILSITGFPLGIQSVTAILMIIGYSLNDTIVVFDRIRENSENIKKEEYLFVINRSINQVLGRTVITSITTLLTVLALLILGGTYIFELSFSICIGIVVGTYSSIFIASPTLIIWENFLHKKAEKKEEKRRRANMPSKKKKKK